MAPSQGWVFDYGRRVTNEYFFDTWVVQLENGQYRLYGNSSDQILYGTNAFDSYLSSNGVDFVKEPGYRFQEDGCFMPCVILLSNGNYRCYYVDQSVTPNPGSDNGGRAIRSALSTNGGLNFVGEGDRLVCNTNLPFEYRGIRGARVLDIGYGTYRMYYHGIDSNDVRRVLSASSDDGTNWTRDPGVRLAPADYCPPCTTVRNFAPIIPFAGDDIHLYVTMSRCGEEWADSHGGIFDSWSVDGLNFTVADQPILESYYIEDTYTGSPTNPQAMPQDPTAIMTANGMRLYFGVYDGPAVLPGTSGIYSVSLPDWDGDGATDEHEYCAGTDPTNPASYFYIAVVSNVPPWTLYFESFTNRQYSLEWSTNLINAQWSVVASQSNILSFGGPFSLNDTNAGEVGFYRIRVRIPPE